MRFLMCLIAVLMVGCCAAEKPIRLRTTLISYSDEKTKVENPFDEPVFLYVNGRLDGALNGHETRIIQTVPGRGYNISMTTDPEIYVLLRKMNK